MFDLDTKVSVERQDSMPEFDFGSEAARKTSKDSILAELADLHGNNNKPTTKKTFNIFGKSGSTVLTNHALCQKYIIEGCKGLEELTPGDCQNGYFGHNFQVL